MRRPRDPMRESEREQENLSGKARFTEGPWWRRNEKGNKDRNGTQKRPNPEIEELATDMTQMGEDNGILKDLIDKLREKVAILEKKIDWQGTQKKYYQEVCPQEQAMDIEVISDQHSKAEEQRKDNAAFQKQKGRAWRGGRLHETGPLARPQQRVGNCFEVLKEGRMGEAEEVNVAIQETGTTLRQPKNTEEQDRVTIGADKGLPANTKEARMKNGGKDGKLDNEGIPRQEGQIKLIEEDNHAGSQNRGGTAIRLNLNKRRPEFSTEELEFFRTAVEHRHGSQAHVTDPGADHCFLCRKIVNGEGLLRKVEVHFDVIHRDSNKVYHIIINNKEESKAIIPARMTGKLRDGAEPPSEEQLELHGGELQQKAKYQPKRNKNWSTEGPANPETMKIAQPSIEIDESPKGGESLNCQGAAASKTTPGPTEIAGTLAAPIGKAKVGVNRKTWKKRATKKSNICPRKEQTEKMATSRRIVKSWKNREQ